MDSTSVRMTPRALSWVAVWPGRAFAHKKQRTGSDSRVRGQGGAQRQVVTGSG